MTKISIKVPEDAEVINPETGNRVIPTANKEFHCKIRQRLEDDIFTFTVKCEGENIYALKTETEHARKYLEKRKRKHGIWAGTTFKITTREQPEEPTSIITRPAYQQTLTAKGDRFTTTFLIHLPRAVANPAILDEIVSSQDPAIEICQYIDPVPKDQAIEMLDKWLEDMDYQMEKSLETRGRIPESLKNERRNTATILDEIMSGRQRLLKVLMIGRIEAGTLEELNLNMSKVKAAFRSRLFNVEITTFEVDDMQKAFLPETIPAYTGSEIYITTDPLSQFITPTDAKITAHLKSPTATILGHTTRGDPAFIDLFGPQVMNFNALILGKSGSGKSSIQKLLLNRLSQIKQVTHIAIIDAVNSEYGQLAKAIGAQTVKMTLSAKKGFNIFEIPGRKTKNKVFNKIHDLQAILESMIASRKGLTDPQIPALHLALKELYQKRATPSMTGLYKILSEKEEEARKDDDRPKRLVYQALASKVRLFTKGMTYGYFDQKNTIGTKDRVHYDLSGLPQGIKHVAIACAINHSIQCMDKPGLKVICIDELAYVMDYPGIMEIIDHLARTARHKSCSFICSTQHPGDLYNHNAGKTILANTDTILLGNHEPQPLKDAVSTFNILAEDHAQYLGSAGRGDFLLLQSGKAKRIKVTPTGEEERLILTGVTEQKAGGLL